MYAKHEKVIRPLTFPIQPRKPCLLGPDPPGGKFFFKNPHICVFSMTSATRGQFEGCILGYPGPQPGCPPPPTPPSPLSGGQKYLEGVDVTWLHLGAPVVQTSAYGHEWMFWTRAVLHSGCVCALRTPDAWGGGGGDSSQSPYGGGGAVPPIHCPPPQVVMVLGATNHPWDLDDAMRRRLEKRIYIPLPEEPDREELFRINLRELSVSNDVDFRALAHMTHGYSGHDVTCVCRDAAMQKLRRLVKEKSKVCRGAVVSRV